MNATQHEAVWQRTQWWRDARFGMFIHWGLYSIPARGEWVRSIEHLSVEDYEPFFKVFNPTEYNPSKWAGTAKAAGMRYGVLTAKHHDGFCLFDSKHTEYKATNSPAKRDLIAEYVEAFRAQGLGVGLYYSLPDWYHPDFSVWKDRQHPMRDHPDWEHKQHDFPKYVDYMHRQIEELMTNYGKIDILWLDFSYNDKTGEAWRATELVERVRQLQPDIVIDNRLGGDMLAEQSEAYVGDFDGPERIIPRQRLFDKKGHELPWESCITLNNNWGYDANDTDWKSAELMIRSLVSCVSKNGNLLINMGPDALGRFPERSVEILDEVGRWLHANGDSIYGAGASDLPKPEWGYYTQKGNILYAHLFEPSVGQYCLPGLKGKVKRAWRVADGAEAFLSGYWNAGVAEVDANNDLFLSLGRQVIKSYALPDPVDTVIALELTQG